MRILCRPCFLLGVPLLLGVTIAAAPHLGGTNWLGTKAAAPASQLPPPEAAELVADQADTLRLPADVARKLGVQTGKVEKATQPRVLTLAGSLALDANRLARVHTRFGGAVEELGTLPDLEPDGPKAGQSVHRQVQLGDKVQKGQLLAVVWCKDLGEKKSELVDALTQLRLDEVRLQKLEEGYQRQAIPEASVRQARRDVAADLNAVSRVERTLRVWRLSDHEIDAVKAEADRIIQSQGKRDRDKEREWARVEVRAPFDGVVLERNIALGDIVDTTTDLFKIADPSRLSVWAWVYENQLPEVLRLPAPIPWTVCLKADPDARPMPGRVEVIGSIVDPVQHTALIRGSVNNSQEKLRAGQFITATIELPPAPGEVVVPISALVEDGKDSVVFVQPDPSRHCYALRRVKVLRRTQDVAHVRGQPLPEEQRQGLQPLQAGERIVTSSVVALKAALEDRQRLARNE